MFFVKQHKSGFSTTALSPIGGSLALEHSQQNPVLAALFGEERPANMLSLLTVLVVLLHLAGILSLLPSNEPETPAKPLIMAVEMIRLSAPKPSVAPPASAPPVEKKLLPIKSKPIPQKQPPVVQKSPDFAPVTPVAESQSSAQTASTQSSIVSESKAPTTSQAEAFTEANYRANYAHNPKPEYPSVAKSRNWQGKVILRVQVSAEGLSNAVAVEHSSGHEMLDESAMEAVKNWRFIPARRGETPVASSVLVPIVFSLRE